MRKGLGRLGSDVHKRQSKFGQRFFGNREECAFLFSAFLDFSTREKISGHSLGVHKYTHILL
jgi:hypothetical protein